MRFQAKQYIRHTQNTAMLLLHWQLQLEGLRLLANAVGATFEGLDSSASVDIAARATPPIGEPADHVTATCVLIGCDTVSSPNNNLKDERTSVNEYLRINDICTDPE